MKVYLGFAKRDLAEWAKGELLAVQPHEPKGGDLDLCDWREVDAASIEAAIADYGPVVNEFASIARHELAEDGVTVREKVANEGRLRLQLSYLKAKRDALASGGHQPDEVLEGQIVSLEEQLKQGLWTRIVNFFVRRN